MKRNKEDKIRWEMKKAKKKRRYTIYDVIY